MHVPSTRFTTTGLLTAVLVLLLAGPAAARTYGPPASFSRQVVELVAIDRREMAPIDNRVLLAAAQDAEARWPGGLLRIAHPFAVDFDLTTSGTWEQLADGSRLWRLRLHSPTARHLNLGFTRFELPAGAALWLYNPAGDYVEGPYTAGHRSPEGELWTPIILGDEVVVELHLPAGAPPAELRVGYVNHGFRVFRQKQGFCNNDVVCPEGDPWRDQIRSVAFYTLNGIGVCSGQLVNNTANDLTPYFLSAEHCGIRPGNAGTMVVYWNYEAPTCGQLSGGSQADNQSGAIFRASDAASDFALVELTREPDYEFNVYYTGWTVSGQVPRSAVGIHHPSLDEKAISFDHDPLTQVDIGFDAITHWRVGQWEDGTTEPGSSGSGLWDPADHRVVGVLTGGFASCEVIDADFYGMLSVAWEGGGTADSRLRDWLDPLNLGVTTHPGRNPGPPPACIPDATTLCFQKRRFKVEVSWATPGGDSGAGQVVPGFSDSAANLWFFSPDNWEVLVKVLDGCSINERFWVLAAAATNVEYTLTVTDTDSDQVRTYTNPQGQLAPALADTAAFAACP